MKEPSNSPFVSQSTAQDSPADTADSGASANATSTAPPPSHGPGRPASYSPDKVHAVCAFIRLTGMSDTAAGALAGVTRSVLSRWKQQDEEVEMELEKARAQYRLPRLEAIGNICRKDGQLDWRAQAWLVKFAAPPEEGAPSRRRRLQDVEVPLTEEEKQAAEEAKQLKEFEAGIAGWAKWKPGMPTTSAMLTVMQWRRQIAREEQQARKLAASGGSPPEVAAACAAIPEPAEAGTEMANEVQEQEIAAEPKEAPPIPEAPALAGAGKSVTIPPEIAVASGSPGFADTRVGEQSAGVPATSRPVGPNASDQIEKSVTIRPEIQAAVSLNHGGAYKDEEAGSIAPPSETPAPPSPGATPPGHSGPQPRMSRQQARAERLRRASEAAKGSSRASG